MKKALLIGFASFVLAGCGSAAEQASSSEGALAGSHDTCLSLRGSLSVEALADMQKSLGDAAVIDGKVSIDGALVAENYTVYDWPQFNLAGTPTVGASVGAADDRAFSASVGERRDVDPAAFEVGKAIFGALTKGTETEQVLGATRVVTRVSKAGYLACSQETPPSGLISYECTLKGIVWAAPTLTCP